MHLLYESLLDLMFDRQLLHLASLSSLCRCWLSLGFCLWQGSLVSCGSLHCLRVDWRIYICACSLPVAPSITTGAHYRLDDCGICVGISSLLVDRSIATDVQYRLGYCGICIGVGSILADRSIATGVQYRLGYCGICISVGSLLADRSITTDVQCRLGGYGI